MMQHFQVKREKIKVKNENQKWKVNVIWTCPEIKAAGETFTKKIAKHKTENKKLKLKI